MLAIMRGRGADNVVQGDTWIDYLMIKPITMRWGWACEY